MDEGEKAINAGEMKEVISLDYILVLSQHDETKRGLSGNENRSI